MKKYLIGLLTGLGFIASVAYGAQVLSGPQGGTGYGYGNLAASSSLLLSNGSGIWVPYSTSTLGISGAGTVTSIATTYPITGGTITTTGTIGIAFGTTTANSWSSLQTLSAGLNAQASSTISWFNSASSSFGLLSIPSIVSALHLADANGKVTAYTGTSCTNQFPRSLSALGAATCASVATSDFASANISQWTNNSGYVTFPWTVNATNNATGTLLLLSGGVMSGASSTLGWLNSASSTIGTLYGTNIVATGTSAGVTFPDGFKQTRGSFNFGATDVNATTTDIFTMQSFPTAVTIQSINGIIDCPNGCVTVASGITVKFWHGTNRSASTTATALFTVNPTFTSTTTLQTFNSGFNDATLAAGEMLWYQIVAASTTQMSIDFTGVGTND